MALMSFGTNIPNVGGTGVPAHVPAGASIVQGGSGGFLGGFGGKIGDMFKTMFSGAPHADIRRATVPLPSREDFGIGTPFTATPVADTKRGAYGTPSREGIAETAATARSARAGFDNPRGTQAFQNLMGLAQEQTGQQESERGRHAADVAQRRGYAGGGDDEARAAKFDRMEALASAGFEGANAIRQQEGEQYGRAIGAFSQLMSAYNAAKTEGDVAYARDLTATHMANAENALKAAGLNMQQQGQYAQSLNEARMLQAQLDQAFNNSLIDNNRYIQSQQSIASQLLATQMSLAEKAREFDIESGFENKKLSFADRELSEKARQFDLGLKASPGTALRTFEDPRYGVGLSPAEKRAKRGSTFQGLV